MNIKEELLGRNLVENNEYLHKYICLIESNLTTECVKYKTQKHHIVPVCAYKICGEKPNNTSENIVNLLYRDHILAHYYLSLCGIGLFKHYNEEAFLFTTNIINKSDEVFDVKTLDMYQSIYESAMRYVAERTKKALTGRNQSKEQIQDRAIKNTGKRRSDETRLKISLRQKGKKKSKESVEKGRATQASLINITNGKLNKRVKPDLLEYYLANGYTLGYTSKKLPKRKWINDGENEIFLFESELYDYLESGWKLGRIKKGTPKTDEWKKNISNSLKGRVFSDEHRKNLSNARIGKKIIRKTPSKSIGRVWINNHEKEMMIYKDELEDYAQQGFILGRLKRK